MLLRSSRRDPATISCRRTTPVSRQVEVPMVCRTGRCGMSSLSSSHDFCNDRDTEALRYCTGGTDDLGLFVSGVQRSARIVGDLCSGTLRCSEMLCAMGWMQTEHFRTTTPPIRGTDNRQLPRQGCEKGRSKAISARAARANSSLLRRPGRMRRREARYPWR